MILLVDDNDAFRLATAEALHTAGLPVVEAVDGEEAWAIFNEEPIELLITDLRLPGVGGEELARRCAQAKPWLPVVVVSSHADADLASRIGAERVEILSKPVRLDRLTARCRALLAGEPAQWTASLRPATTKIELPVAPPAGWDKSPTVFRSSAAEPPENKDRLLWLGIGLTLVLCLVLACGLAVAFFPHGPLADDPAAVAKPALDPAPRQSPTQVGTELGTIETIAPSGPVGQNPAALVWQAYPGASRYHVRLQLGQTLVADEFSVATEWALPAPLAQQLEPVVAYSWQVDAVDPLGNLVASSTPTRFRVIPSTNGP